MSHKTLVKIIFVTFLFNNFPICTANDETEPSLTTGSSRAEKLTSSASPVSSSRTENEDFCVPREKRCTLYTVHLYCIVYTCTVQGRGRRRDGAGGEAADYPIADDGEGDTRTQRLPMT